MINAGKIFENNVLIPLSNKHKDTKLSNNPTVKGNRKYLEYDGHQNILGHYFRHIFQTVKFVNDQEILNYKEKYDYIKILRAQLSTHEQVLFFYNSLSTIGMPWERDQGIKDENFKLITKYNLVKNITFELNQIIDVKTFYPRVIYEGQTKNSLQEQIGRTLHLTNRWSGTQGRCLIVQYIDGIIGWGRSGDMILNSGHPRTLIN